jgi:hypothetical protein
MTNIESKHGIVSRQPHELYMAFTDLQNFRNMLPEDKKEMVTATFDTLTATVQGFNIGVKMHERVPYSRIELVDFGAPFAFHIVMHFDPSAQDTYKTDFWIQVEADLNLMMKMMLSGKLKEALDKVVDGLVDASNGKMPEGFDLSQWEK